MSFRFPNGKSPKLDIETFAVDFETIGQLQYIKSCVQYTPFQRDATSGVHVLFCEQDYDYDSLNHLVLYLSENKVAISSLKVGNLDELIADLGVKEDIITVGMQPPRSWSNEGITHLEPESIEHLSQSGALRNLWPIEKRNREVATLYKMFLL